jgi:hypothetical protein
MKEVFETLITEPLEEELQANVNNRVQRGLRMKGNVTLRNPELTVKNTDVIKSNVGTI